MQVTQNSPLPTQHHPQFIAVGDYGLAAQTVDSKHKYKKILSGLGMVECLMGVVSILLSVVAASIARNEAAKFVSLQTPDHSYYYVDVPINYIVPGVWGGVFIVITGILGICAKSNPTGCLYIANMVMAILTSIAAGFVVFLSGMTADITAGYSTSLLVLHITIAFLGFIVFILTIIHAAFCCGGVCCKGGSYDAQQLIQVPQSTGPNQDSPQFLQSSDQEQILFIQQPVEVGQDYPHPLRTEHKY